VEVDAAIRIREHEDVYRPAEDSYLLLKAIDLRYATTFLDVGTGTGIIALHAARRCRTVATDINPRAVSLCRSNAALNGLNVEVVRTDLFRGLKGTFDIIAFNPPYLPSDREGWLEKAWSGGPDGNQVILRFLEQAAGHLARDGRIYLLMSSHNTLALREAQESYRCTPLRRQPLFFEEIAVYELRLG
jgi:release factor glutamine methyltransferase